MTHNNHGELTVSQQDTDPTLEAVRLLRESGYHEAAADLAAKALQRAATPPPATTAATTAPPPTDPRLAAEAAAQAEGQHILDAMRARGIRAVQDGADAA